MSLFACIWRIINPQHYISSCYRYFYTFQNDHRDQFSYSISPCCPCCSLAVKLCSTVCDPMNYCIPGFPSLSSEVCSNSCPVCHYTKILCTYWLYITILAQKQTHRSGQQNREPRAEHTWICAINLWQRRQACTVGKESLINKWFWKNWTAICKRVTLDYSLTPCTKIHPKWIKDLNVRPEIITLLEENIGTKLLGISLSISVISSQARETKAILNKWDNIKLKVFAQQRKQQYKKGHLLNGRRYLQLTHLI